MTEARYVLEKETSTKKPAGKHGIVVARVQRNFGGILSKQVPQLIHLSNDLAVPRYISRRHLCRDNNLVERVDHSVLKIGKPSPLVMLDRQGRIAVFSSFGFKGFNPWRSRTSLILLRSSSFSSITFFSVTDSRTRLLAFAFSSVLSATQVSFAVNPSLWIRRRQW